MKLEHPEKFNIPLGEQVLSHVVAHPELHDQATVGVYDCNTPGCIAGWACHFAKTESHEVSMARYGRMDVAAQLLGFVEPNQRYYASMASRTLFGEDEEGALEMLADFIVQAHVAQDTADQFELFEVEELVSP